MNSCELVTAISAIACIISKDNSSQENAFLGSVFAQLGDTLSTISAQQDLCNTKKESCDTQKEPFNMKKESCKNNKDTAE